MVYVQVLSKEYLKSSVVPSVCSCTICRCTYGGPLAYVLYYRQECTPDLKVQTPKVSL
jgi:hypothetical protein